MKKVMKEVKGQKGQQQLREQKHWALENKRADELKDGPFLKCDAGFHQI